MQNCDCNCVTVNYSGITKNGWETHLLRVCFYLNNNRRVKNTKFLTGPVTFSLERQTTLGEFSCPCAAFMAEFYCNTLTKLLSTRRQRRRDGFPVLFQFWQKIRHICWNQHTHFQFTAKESDHIFSLRCYVLASISRVDAILMMAISTPKQITK